MTIETAGEASPPADVPVSGAQTLARMAPIVFVFVVGLALLLARPTISSANVEHNAPPNHIAVEMQQANWAELATLPGLGETLARRIVAHRERLQSEGRSVDSSEALLEVNGIGPKRLAALKPYLSFGVAAQERE